MKKSGRKGPRNFEVVLMDSRGNWQCFFLRFTNEMMDFVDRRAYGDTTMLVNSKVCRRSKKYER